MLESQVPRYFTDFDDGLEFYQDDIGSDLQNLYEAQKQALSLFKQVGLERLISAGGGSAVVTIRDACGSKVFSSTLTLR